MKLKCEKCSWEGHPNLEETGPHTKATCGECGAYIKMLSKQDIGKLIEATYRSVRKEQKAKAPKSMVKRVIMDRGDALDAYIEIRDKIRDIPVSEMVYKDAILVILTAFAESHSAALSRIEELEAKINDPLFGEKATQARIDQMQTNFNFLYNHIQAMHMKLCPHKAGTWQDETIQVWTAIQEMTRGK